MAEQYIASLSSSAPLAAYLNSCSYTDRDYLYDALGTLYLENRDYANAARVLAKVSNKYQALLNVNRDGFLRRDPFAYLSVCQKNDWYSNGHSYFSGPGPKDLITNHKKLYFAREMLRLEQEIKSARDPNKRAMARLKYSIGLENSFNNCWALTSYCRGPLLVAAQNTLTPQDEWEEICGIRNYSTPHDKKIIKATKDADALREKALAEITDPETAARANLMLYNYLTIAKHYPNTAIGRMLASQCDAWSDWI